MSSIVKHGNDKWRAYVTCNGVKASKVFVLKAKAIAWANRIEIELEDSKNGSVPDKTFGQLMQRYLDEVSVNKKGNRSEALKIGKFLREDDLAKVKLIDLNERDIAAWRDRRLEVVQGASVKREWNILGNACNIAVREWKWLKANPMKLVKRPESSPPRDRTATDVELEEIHRQLGDDLNQVIGRIGMIARFALETAMRAGEITDLIWENVLFDKQKVKVGYGLVQKTASAKREVPLSVEAIRILEAMPRGEPTDSVFNVNSAQLDALFRKARDKAMIEDLNFHDLRHTAITRLAKKMDVLPLAKMIGHKDLRMLMIYYNPSATDLAKLLG